MALRTLLIVGISGVGKSVLGREAASRSGLPLHPMDSLIWRPNWQEAPEDEVAQAVATIAEGDAWIVEGWIDRYSAPLLARADAVLWLDLPGWQAALGGLERALRLRGQRRPEMPEGCTESADGTYLTTMLLRRERPHIAAILAPLPPGKVVRVRSRGAARRWLRRALAA